MHDQILIRDIAAHAGARPVHLEISFSDDEVWIILELSDGTLSWTIPVHGDPERVAFQYECWVTAWMACYLGSWERTRAEGDEDSTVYSLR